MNSGQPLIHPLSEPLERGFKMTIAQMPMTDSADLGVTPPGSFLWWILRDSATPPAALKSAAKSAGFPARFLPSSVKPQVIFRRALERAAANAPADLGRWRVDIVRPNRKWKLRAPPALDAWRTESDSHLGVVEKWEPESFEEPWHVRLWIGMREQMFKAFEILDDGTAVDVTDVATGTLTSSGGGPSVSQQMARRIFEMLSEEESQATAPEIGEGVQKALEDVDGAKKLRPGLYFLPGEDGTARAKVTADYLDKVGHTVVGMYTF
jgi:hypothetical protein